MIKSVDRIPRCCLCSSPGRKKGGVKSEANRRVFYERYYVCTKPCCMARLTPVPMRKFEGGERAFGDR